MRKHNPFLKVSAYLDEVFEKIVAIKKKYRIFGLKDKNIFPKKLMESITLQLVKKP